VLAGIVVPFANAGDPAGRLTTDGRFKRDPVLIDNGAAVLYSVLETPSRLRLMKLNLATGESTSIHPDATNAEFEPAVSRDGKRLAYVQSRANLNLTLVIRDNESDESHDVTPSGGFSGMRSPVFSPDGTTVLFSYPDGGRQQIFSVTPDGRNRTSIIDSPGINNWPDFSPDGMRIVFSSTREGDYDLYTADRTGGNIRKLVSSPRQDIRPRFSPDGRHIAFTSHRDGNPEIYVMQSSGEHPVRVTDHPELDDYPCWAADGHSLIAICERSGQFDLYRIAVPVR